MERMKEREALLAELETGGYLTDPRLEEAMLSVPRHLFVPKELRDTAYEDRPLPIGFGQTVSAPHMTCTIWKRRPMMRERRKSERISSG